jgi:hypothetical protein
MQQPSHVKAELLHMPPNAKAAELFSAPSFSIACLKAHASPSGWGRDISCCLVSPSAAAGAAGRSLFQSHGYGRDIPAAHLPQQQLPGECSGQRGHQATNQGAASCDAQPCQTGVPLHAAGETVRPALSIRNSKCRFALASSSAHGLQLPAPIPNRQPLGTVSTTSTAQYTAANTASLPMHCLYARQIASGCIGRVSERWWVHLLLLL